MGDFNYINDVLEKQTYSTHIIENLINDLLDLAKIQNNKFNLNQCFFNLTDTINQTFEILKFLAHEKNIELVMEI